MDSSLEIDLIKVFVKHGLLPDICLRDERIRLLYQEMKESGRSPKEARKALSETFFTSEATINSILYNKGRARKSLNVNNK